MDIDFDFHNRHEPSIGAQILSPIADSMAAMLEDGSHRPAMTLGQALAERERGSGRQYDPALCRAFLDNSGAAELVLGGHCRSRAG
jgi:HD-GYP domain-containing protein (c-di-GMP phosphodiesterase class II)